MFVVFCVLLVAGADCCARHLSHISNGDCAVVGMAFAVSKLPVNQRTVFAAQRVLDQHVVAQQHRLRSEAQGGDHELGVVHPALHGSPT